MPSGSVDTTFPRTMRSLSLTTSSTVAGMDCAMTPSAPIATSSVNRAASKALLPICLLCVFIVLYPYLIWLVTGVGLTADDLCDPVRKIADGDNVLETLRVLEHLLHLGGRLWPSFPMFQVLKTLESSPSHVLLLSQGQIHAAHGLPLHAFEQIDR